MQCCDAATHFTVTHSAESDSQSDMADNLQRRGYILPVESPPRLLSGDHVVRLGSPLSHVSEHTIIVPVESRCNLDRRSNVSESSTPRSFLVSRLQNYLVQEGNAALLH
jgi:hypothetical protein